MPTFDMSTLVLPLILGVTFLGLVTAGIGLNLETRRRRLPEATRLEDALQRLEIAEANVTRAEERLATVNAQIQDRDRFAAEVAVLLERVEALKAELATLEPARQEIEQVKAEAAKAAEAYAVISADAREAEERLAALRKDLDPEHVERLRKEKEEAEKTLAEITNQLPELEAKAAEARRAIAEGEARTATAAALEQRIADLQTARADAEAALAPLAEQRDALAAEISRLRADLQAMEDRRSWLSHQIANLEKALPGTGPEATEENRRVLLADLVSPAACLAQPAALRGAAMPEAAALQSVASALTAQGLAYPERILKAFHTSLKINDSAQITVLAGVSGTGKSLLPRAYARALGLHFLQIAVEPRWDSPQDLLGFYNYVEKRYRATELARVLLQSDPYRELELPEGTPDRSDRVTLVLLDEMNLARVEYYFSEFLSRLEARPRYRDAGNPARRRDALIPLDIRGLVQAPSLYPAHNLLFAGTMNDDESTQALSDKVLDRGNILQFPAPKRFATPARRGFDVTDEALPLRTWRSWVKGAPEGRALHDVDEIVAALSGIMQRFGRPFGFRLRDAMLAYAANYPADGPMGGDSVADIRVAMADQVELRILPKLRGIEIDRHVPEFDALEQLIRGRLADGVFADALSRRREAQAQGTGLFVWGGLARGPET